MKLFGYIAAVLMTAVSVSCGKTYVPEMAGDYDGEGLPVRVNIGVGASPFAGATRSLQSHTYEVENLIHDIWVVQFNNRGQRIKSDYFAREGQAGQYVENFEAELISARECTVCLVANTETPSLHWPDNLPDFRTMMFDVQANNSLDRTRIPMCGYWQGDVTGTTVSLSVLLSRMMARINIVVNNNTGRSLDGLSVEISNIPTLAYVYPQVDHAALSADAYLQTPFADMLQGSFANGASATFYHYIAPNICDTEAFATKVRVLADNSEWSVVLGSNSPQSEDRIYTLYANNYYTFTLNLTE